MLKILFMLVLVFVVETLSQRIIHPTWRPPPRRTITIRTARDLSDQEPLWLYKGDNIDRAPATGDHPILPKIIDDIKMDQNKRYARSVDSPSAKRSSSSHSSSSSSRDSGPTYPEFNRRNARGLLPTFRLLQTYHRPSLPTLPGNSRKPFPIYASTRIA